MLWLVMVRNGCGAQIKICMHERSALNFPLPYMKKLAFVGKKEDIIEEVDKDRRGSRRTKEGNSSNNRSAEAAAGERLTGPVDRPQ